MGYAPPGTNPLELIDLAREAERLGYRSAWAAEAWGTDAVTVLSWLAATTSTIDGWNVQSRAMMLTSRGAAAVPGEIGGVGGGVPGSQAATTARAASRAIARNNASRIRTAGV